MNGVVNLLLFLWKVIESQIMTLKYSQIVLLFLALSFVGWIVFVAGFGELVKV